MVAHSSIPAESYWTATWTPDGDAFTAFQYGNLVRVRKLISKDPTILRTRKDLGLASGTTLLHLAAISRSPELVALIVDQGVAVDILDDHRMTPLHNACMYEDNLEIITLLLERGADIDATGSTPLDWSRKTERHETTDFLSKRGAKSGH